MKTSYPVSHWVSTLILILLSSSKSQIPGILKKVASKEMFNTKKAYRFSVFILEPPSRSREIVLAVCNKKTGTEEHGIAEHFSTELLR